MKGELSFGAGIAAGTSALPRVVDVGDAWRDAAADVTDAYRLWSTAPRSYRVDAHAAYLAAMDREAAAARYLRLVLDRAATG